MKLYDPGLMALKFSMIEEENAYLRAEFRALSPGPRGLRYTPRQRAWAVNKAGEIGVRATAKVLRLERRTIQRWLRAEGVRVRRTPYWIYEWVETRNRRRAKWARIKAN